MDTSNNVKEFEEYHYHSTLWEKILCFLGFHDWMYDSDTKRMWYWKCCRCGKTKYSYK